jgi:acyl-coenzyme A thioesterase PaaI-like protein
VPAAWIQDQIVDNYCWGCGADNPDGLQLKSYWDGELAVAQWRPRPEYAAGPRHILNGGIIATVLDCHGVCTAIAHAYQKENRTIGSGPEIWCATASMTVEYLRPTPIDGPIHLSAQVTAVEERMTVLECSLEADGKERARASLRAIRVPTEWRHGVMK